jgi:RNA recognition motif-containing protein
MNIYIGNLSLKTTEAELRRMFEKYGTVLSVTILNDAYIGSGQPRGYGYVDMESKSDGTSAIKGLQGKSLKDHVVNIVEALPLTRRNGALSSPETSHGGRCKSRSHRYF